MENFDLRKYLAEGKLFEEEQSSEDFIIARIAVEFNYDDRMDNEVTDFFVDQLSDNPYGANAWVEDDTETNLQTGDKIATIAYKVPIEMEDEVDSALAATDKKYYDHPKVSELFTSLMDTRIDREEMEELGYL